MALEKVRNILADADKHQSSVIAFDAMDYPTISSAIFGAEAAHRPVIVMLYPAMDRYMPLEAFASMVKNLAAKVKVPVGLHLDHCSNYDYIVNAVKCGFTSVMADGSMLPFDQNVEFTSSVVKAARIFDVDVEGELGHVGRGTNTDDYTVEESYTRPEDAAKFADITGVASLAIAIGRAHGVYKSTPKLSIERLDEINKATDIPLVLHGGSGIPHDQLAEAFKKGINKFNVGTEFFKLNQTAAREYFNLTPEPGTSFDHIDYVQRKLQDYIEQKILLTTYEV